MSKLETKKDKSEDVSHPPSTCGSASHFLVFSLGKYLWVLQISHEPEKLRNRLVGNSDLSENNAFVNLHLMFETGSLCSSAIIYTQTYRVSAPLPVTPTNSDMNSMSKHSGFSFNALRYGVRARGSFPAMQSPSSLHRRDYAGVLQFPGSWYHSTLLDDPLDGATSSQRSQKRLDVHPGGDLCVRADPNVLNPSVLQRRCK